MTSKITDKECLCAFVATLDPGLKSTVVNFLLTVQGVLKVVKAQALIVTNVQDVIEDQLKLSALEVGEAVIEQVAAPIEGSVSYVNGIFRPYADCAPISGVASTIRNARDAVVSEIDAIRDEIQNLKDAISEKNQEIELLDRSIAQIDEFIAAMEEC